MSQTTAVRAPLGPTLAVVAREAGVSVPTASKVVNGRRDVAPETRRRVTEVLDRLGYIRRREPAARQRPALVDLVVHSLDTSWSSAVLHGVEAAAHRAGLEVMVSAGLSRGHGDRSGRGLLDRIATRGSSGVLLNLAELSPSQYAWLAGHHIPVVLIDPTHEPPAGALTVGATNLRGGASATEHLLGLGHERIAVIGGSPRKPCAAERIAGYRFALRAAGVEERPGYVTHGGFSRDEARLRMRELLDLRQPPTAVFACSDQMALGACDAMAERGMRVPDDLSVVGFDDLPEASWPAPGLTTVRQPLAAMAATAIRALTELLAGGTPGIPHRELPTRLVVRGSTAAPPSGPAPRALTAALCQSRGSGPQLLNA